jgi:hypothetical protein
MQGRISLGWLAHGAVLCQPRNALHPPPGAALCQTTQGLLLPGTPWHLGHGPASYQCASYAQHVMHVQKARLQVPHQHQGAKNTCQGQEHVPHHGMPWLACWCLLTWPADKLPHRVCMQVVILGQKGCTVPRSRGGAECMLVCTPAGDHRAAVGV